jgi:serine/threonine protein kinase
MLLTLGARLGPYTIESLIGSGGMGEVYKAHDARLNRTVAIKRMIADDVSRFQSEARAIAAINHPHICQIYDVGPDYLVLEYLRGKHSAGRCRKMKRCGWRARLPTHWTLRTNAAFFTAI